MRERDAVHFGFYVETAKILLHLFGRDALRPLDRAQAVVIEIFDGRLAQKAAVVVSLQRHETVLSDKLNTFIREWTVADRVPKAIQHVCLVAHC